MNSGLLEVQGLHVSFRARGRKGRAGRGNDGRVRAVDGVSFALDRGEVLALVGESGSGKTTTAHAAMRLVEPNAGTVRFKGQDLRTVSSRQLRSLRKQMQLIYQDPYESLDPRYTVRRVIEEPLRIHRIGEGRGERAARAVHALERVGLTPTRTLLDRFPHELSGGQRQRLSIAVALTLDPDMLVADEPVSMLDVSVRAGILDILDQLRGSGLGILMITHDLSTAAHYADRIAIMYLGRIVEIGPSRQIVTSPRHPYTRALLSVVPKGNRAGARRALLPGEVPDAAALPTGCRFHPRCPSAIELCASLDPTLRQASPGSREHQIACHLDLAIHC